MLCSKLLSKKKHSKKKALLQIAVDKNFYPHRDRLLAIHDNFLLCGTSYDDMFTQLKSVLATCRASNLYLKPSKCKFGVNQVEFFGYVCTHEKYFLKQQRVERVQAIAYPGDVPGGKGAARKAMQSYLGMANFFSGFIPDYAIHTDVLYDMTKIDFDWTPARTADNVFRSTFEAHKTLIAKSFEIFFPNYELEWILRVDASMIGCGYILLQRLPNGILQPIQMGSTKFSEPARRWHCMHQEAYAIWYAVRQLHVRLQGKPFTLQTDHRNLLWMEQSKDPKIMRYMQSLANYQFMVEHIPGRLNIVADVLSRLHPTEAVHNIEQWILEAASDPLDSLYGLSPLYGDYDVAGYANATGVPSIQISSATGGLAGTISVDMSYEDQVTGEDFGDRTVSMTFDAPLCDLNQ